MKKAVFAVFTRIALTGIYGLCLLLHALLGPVGAVVSRVRRPRRASDDRYQIVVIGTFYTRNWCISHLTPLVRAHNVSRVFAVVDGPVQDIPNVIYVYPPAWMLRLLGRAFSKFLMTLSIALEHRPALLMGYHLLPNALTAQIVARLVGARCGYQMTAGPIEVIGGGAATENFFLKQLGVHSPFIEKLAFAVARRFDLIVVRGEKAQDFMTHRQLGGRVCVVPGSINTRRLAPRGEPRIYDVVSVCRLVPIKQPQHIIEVLGRLRQRKPDLRAAILGDGPLLGELRTLARERGVEDNVTFMGHVEDVERILVQSKVFLLASRSEGLSIAMAEAMAAGVVPVVADVGDLGDLAENGRTGWRVTPGAFDEYAERIYGLISNEATLTAYSEAARERAIEHNDVEQVARRWASTFDAVCAAGGDRRTRAQTIGATRPLLPSRRAMWDRTPARVKEMLTPMMGRISPERLLGSDFRRMQQFIDRSERWGVEQQQAYQLAQLRLICDLARERSPYYRKAFRDVGFEPNDLRSVEDIRYLPTISQRTVREHLDEMLTADPGTFPMDAVSTGGTSGRPLKFYINVDRSSVEYAYLVATWRRAGYDLRVAQAVFRGQVVTQDSSGLHHEYDPILRRHYYSNFHMTDENIRRYLEHIATIGPCYLHVYPSSAAVIARYLEKTGAKAPSNILGVLAGSENVYRRDRELIERVLNVRFFSWYGHTEKLVLAGECEHCPDYHVWPTYGYFELLDPWGRPVRTPGQRGEIVGTGFINTIVPFIRYHTGDYATYVGDRCSACGREHPVIRDVTGHRTQEMLVAGDGALISWTSLNMHDDTFDRVRQIQFHQVRPGVATLRIVPEDGFGSSDMEAIRAGLNRKLAGRISFDIETVSEIQLTPMGKRTYVDQQIDLSTLLDDSEPVGSEVLSS